MLPTKMKTAMNSRLRVVFKDGVLSLGIAAGTTLADVARMLRLLPKQHGSPVAISVTLPADVPSSPLSLN